MLLLCLGREGERGGNQPWLGNTYYEGVPTLAMVVPTLAEGVQPWSGVLILAEGVQPWLGVPTLAKGYLPWLGGIYPGQGVPTLGQGVPTLAWGTWLGGTYLGWGYLPWTGGGVYTLARMYLSWTGGYLLRTREVLPPSQGW